MAAKAETDRYPNLTETPNQATEPYEEIEEDVEDEENELDDEENELEDEDEETLTPEARLRKERAGMNSILRRLTTEQIPVLVYDVIIKGNSKTKESLILSEVEWLFRDATSFRDLLRAAGDANSRLHALEIFEAVNISLDAGPPELPGTANVVIDVSEPAIPLSGNVGAYTNLETRSWTAEGILKLKNMFGYGDIWDASVAYGWNQAPEISTGVSLPRFKRIPTPLSARISLSSQDWLNFSSYKEKALGISLGLLATGKHNIYYNLSWQNLTDPTQMSSHAVRNQLGHSLLSSLKYVFKVDRRDSLMRPTRGHAFISTAQIGGLFPDMRSLRFIRQDFDFRYAIPFGFYRTALNFGLSGCVFFPLGNGSLSAPSYLPERFFMGGNNSPICSLSGPTSGLGFKARGLGPAEPRRVVRDSSSDENSNHLEVDRISGDLALTAFANLSFDLPLKTLRDADIHGHVFASTGSLNKLSEGAYKEFSLQKFRDSFRTSAGVGVVVPTKLFRMEVNYCHVLKQQGHDQGKYGIQFCFSGPQ